MISSLRIVALLAIIALGCGAPPVSAAAPSPHQPAVVVLIELWDEPTVVAWSRSRQLAPAGAATMAAQSQAARVEAAQARVLPHVARAGGRTLYRLQRTLNGIVAAVPPASLAELGQAPGVRAVRPLRPARLANSRGVAQIGAPKLWEAAGLDVRGEGVRIGIIDTGIDYLHTNFGGSGRQADYNRNNTTIADDVGFPSLKIVGGHDFAGDNYNADDPANLVPRPDPDPADCHGHGTHVAGTAAGFGVESSGATYGGPWNATDVPTATMRVGPGVAPQATLYALRVFGCGGSSNLVAQALEWAVDPNADGNFDDRLDVVNLSLGSPFGGPGPDPLIDAANNAALAGVVVVAAASNDGDVFYNLSTPGSADWAISVAATVVGERDTIAAFSSRGPRGGDAALKPDLAAPGVSIVSAASGSGTDASTLSGTSMAAPHVAGALALLRQAHPDWTVEELKALAITTASAQPRSADDQAYSLSRQGAGRIDLPAAARAEVVAFNADNPGQVSLSFGAPQVTSTLTLVKQLRVVNKGNADASFSLGVTEVVTSAGVTVAPLAPSVLVPAGGSATVGVQLTIDPSKLDRTLDPASAAAWGVPAPGVPVHFLNEHAGFITLGGPEALQVPFYVAPRPASELRVEGGLSFGGGTSASLRLTGSGVSTPAYESLVWALELQERDEAPYGGPCAPSGAIRYIGVGSDVGDEVLSETSMIFFGLVSAAPRSSPHPGDTLFTVRVNTDGDEADEYAITNRYVSGAGNPFLGYVARVEPLNGTAGSARSWRINYLTPSVETAPFNSTVLVLPVAAGDLGLSAGNSRFSYRVTTSQTDQPLCDTTAVHSFDPAQPAYSAVDERQGAPLHEAAAGATIDVRLNPQSVPADAPAGLLLLHHLNRADAQAEVVPIGVALRRLHLPLVGQSAPARSG